MNTEYELHEIKRQIENLQINQENLKNMLSTLIRTDWSFIPDLVEHEKRLEGLEHASYLQKEINGNLNIQLSNMHERLDELEEGSPSETLVVERFRILEAEIAALKGVNQSIVTNQFMYTEWLDQIDRNLNDLIDSYEEEVELHVPMDDISLAIEKVQVSLEHLKHLFKEGE